MLYLVRTYYVLSTFLVQALCQRFLRILVKGYGYNFESGFLEINYAINISNFHTTDRKALPRTAENSGFSEEKIRRFHWANTTTRSVGVQSWMRFKLNLKSHACDSYWITQHILHYHVLQSKCFLEKNWYCSLPIFKLRVTIRDATNIFHKNFCWTNPWSTF